MEVVRFTTEELKEIKRFEMLSWGYEQLIKITSRTKEMHEKEYQFCKENMTRISVKNFTDHKLTEGANECLVQAKENLNHASRSLKHWEQRLKELSKTSQTETESQSLKQDYKF